jgi:hypothetical protein
MNTKLHSPIPFFLLTALLGLVPVLNNKYPAYFFSALSPWLVEVLSVALGAAAAFGGFSRGWEILKRRSWARELVRQTAVERHAAQNLDANDVNNAGRLISRLVRNADEDLLEIKPDFSEASLKRLRRVLPALLDEIKTAEDARIRVGVVGTYLGETACRNRQWQWFFKSDPALRQFSYLASVLRRAEGELDPFAWAADLMTGQRKTADWLEAIR